MPRATDDIAAEVATLQEKLRLAMNAAIKAKVASWANPDHKAADDAFLKALRRVHTLEAEMAALYRKAAGGRFVHADAAISTIQ